MTSFVDDSSLFQRMNISHKFTALLLCPAFVGATATAEFTAAAQEISATIEAYCDNLREINTLMQGITDRATADAATAPLRIKTKEMILNLRSIKELSIDFEPSIDDQKRLSHQVLELQILQADFEKNCIRLAEANFYDSVMLARLFYAIADIYRREQEGNIAPTAASAAPEERTITEEERRHREQRRNERAKLYGNK